MSSIVDIQKACQNSLWYLCEEILGFRDWDTIHYEIEAFLKRPSKLKLLLVPRGHLKTSVCTIGWTIQRLLKNPNARILIANQVWDKSREMLYEIKEFLTTKSVLPKVFDRFESNRWTVDDIVVNQRTQALAAASIATTGVEAETTSSHYDMIICDDLQGLNNVQTKEQRDKVKRYYRSMKDLADSQNTDLLVLGTRWHQDDLYAEILEKEGKYFDTFIRQAIEHDQPIFPKKFSLEYLEYLKATRPSSEFSAQYMNNPIAEESQLFKQSYIKYFQTIPSGMSPILSIDPAISESRDADYSGLAVSSKDSESNVYVLGAERVKGLQKSLEKIIFFIRAYDCRRVVIETRGFQAMYKQHIFDAMRKNDCLRPIEEFKGPQEARAKERRIEALHPYFIQGKIFFSQDMKELELELLEFPHSRHDDLADSLSMAVNYLKPGWEASSFSKLAPKPGTLNWVLKHEMGDQSSLYERYLKDMTDDSSFDMNKVLYGKALAKN